MCIDCLLNPWQVACAWKMLNFKLNEYIRSYYSLHETNMVLGASMVKSTKKMLWYLKTIVFLFKCLKVVVNCYVKYSNVTYQDEIFINLLLNVMLKSKWLDMVLDVNFMTLTIWNLIFFFIFLEFTI